MTLLGAAVMLNCNSATKNEVGTKVQPNIILFLVDDMGWQDTSVPFWKETTPLNKKFRTPNMQKLAGQGMMFTQAYATPVCSPTRVSLLTGMNAARHRVTNWTLQRDKLQPMELNHKSLEFPFWNVNGMVADSAIEHAVFATPFPAILQAHGYRTIHVGKAHFGSVGTSGENPLNLGFDVNVAGHAAGAPKSYWGDQNFGNTPEFTGTPWPVPGLESYYGQQINLTEVLTKEAMKEMDSAREEGKPFYLYMAHYTVHTPLMADRRYFQGYLDAGLDSAEAKYASMVEGMDKSLGDLMNYLEEIGIDDNTIILFMSDNGGLSAHSRSGGPPHTHNEPLSSGKGSMREGGIREPMIAKWPGVTLPGSKNDHYLIIEDFYPTILEMAGIEDYETRQEIDGQSFTALLKDVSNELMERALIWHYPNEWGPSGPGIGAASTIRKGDWKLIYYHNKEEFELFNLAEDIGESKNLVSSNEAKRNELAIELTNYLKSVDAQMPKHKENGMQVHWPADIL
jgi:arylsulfatase A-like enzyme